MVGLNPLTHTPTAGRRLNESTVRRVTLTFRVQLFLAVVFLSVFIKDTDVQDAEGSQDGATGFDHVPA